jgi:broad specificity phosphatase PhoE
MTPLLLIRHGLTEWNASGRIQGRADIGLSARGRAEVGGWRLPAAWAGGRWLTSPLRRAGETAALLTERPVVVEPRLIEMDWGAFEGRRARELRAEAPATLAANEALGLDFRPPGGESPREVGARLQALVAELAAEPGPVVAVCHKGVIRAALALATGWDMRARPPLRLARDQALALYGHRDGRLDLGPAPLALAA